MNMSHRNRPESRHLFIRCGRLINPSTESVMEDACVEINSGKILKISGCQTNLPPDAEILDYGNKTIIPGLIDTHGHLYGRGPSGIRYICNEDLATLYLAAGVTTVRLPGSMEPDTDLALRSRIDTGHFDGPRLFLSGIYLDMPATIVRWIEELNTPEEARLKIDHSIACGATSVKIYASMCGEILKAAIEHGHAHGVKVIAHVGAVSFKEAIEMGIDELFHGVVCCPETFPPDMKTVDYMRIFETVPGLDLEQTAIPEMLALARDAGTVITPTAAVVQPMDLTSRTQVDQKRFFTPEAWEKLANTHLMPDKVNEEGLFRKQIEFIRMAYETGCTLTTGTDITNYSKLPGFSLYDEMEIFAMAGIPCMDILKAATCNAAGAIGRSDLLGALLPGKLADMVVLDGDPLQDISHVREVNQVIKAGVVYDPQMLYEPLVGKMK
jgi:imidazolonepropionase-like amidohydrolase